MTADEEPRAATEGVHVVEETLGELRAELGEAGVVLPSLRVDPVSWAAQDVPPLVDLGRCNLATARQLVAALREQRS
ncbi:hypothetical protein ABT112_30155 [Streptomyces sp. NPDC002055]|uniref:hypothetical protein n=1 Tax=Streptomyces sp. NPDC002055 TaxID=3154534 RepID=UPI0033172553